MNIWTTYDITARSRSSARDLLEEFIEGDLDIMW